jgi:hypothetical protein
MSKFVGNHLIDCFGNDLPEEDRVKGEFIHHNGSMVWIQSPTGGESDTLTFIHRVEPATAAWINRHYEGQIVEIRITRHLTVDGWWESCTIHGVSVHSI